jgi:nucleoid DNA-binding protein
MAVIEGFLSLIPAELANRNIVKLGEFGSFWLRADTEGQDTPSVIGGQHIKAAKVRFTPDKEFKQAPAVIDFEKA